MDVTFIGYDANMTDGSDLQKMSLIYDVNGEKIRLPAAAAGFEAPDSDLALQRVREQLGDADTLTEADILAADSLEALRDIVLRLYRMRKR